MALKFQKPNTFAGRQKHIRVVPISCSKHVKFGDFVDKRREVDKQRIERVREIGNTLDHIAKGEFKDAVEIMKNFMPFLKNLKNDDKIETTWPKEE